VLVRSRGKAATLRRPPSELELSGWLVSRHLWRENLEQPCRRSEDPLSGRGELLRRFGPVRPLRDVGDRDRFRRKPQRVADDGLGK
jgi:hypothetical protein